MYILVKELYDVFDKNNVPNIETRDVIINTNEVLEVCDKADDGLVVITTRNREITVKDSFNMIAEYFGYHLPTDETND